MPITLLHIFLKALTGRTCGVRRTIRMSNRVVFYFRRQIKQLIGMAIISIAAGQCIGIAHRALVVTMHRDELNGMTAEQTNLGLHTA
jgi:hypothetical protein